MRKNYLTDFIYYFNSTMTNYNNLEHTMGFQSMEEFHESEIYNEKLTKLRNMVYNSRITQFSVFENIIKECSKDHQLIAMMSYDRILRVKEMMKTHSEDLIKLMKNLDKKFKDATMIENLKNIGVIYNVKRSNAHAMNGEWLGSHREPLWRVTMIINVDHINIINRTNQTSFKLPFETALKVDIHYQNFNFLNKILSNSKIIDKVLNNDFDFLEMLMDTDETNLPFTSRYQIAEDSIFSHHPFMSTRNSDPCLEGFADQVANGLRNLDFLGVGTSLQAWLTTYYQEETNPHHRPESFLYNGIPEDAGTGIDDFHPSENAYNICWERRSSSAGCDHLNCALRSRCPNYIEDRELEATPITSDDSTRLSHIMSNRASYIINIMQRRDSLSLITEIVNAENATQISSPYLIDLILIGEVELFDDLNFYFTQTQGDTPNG